MPETIKIDVQDSVTYLTLNRPDVHNAMSNQMVAEIIDYLASIRQNRAIRAVVIGAAGKTFCAGGDIKDLQASAGLPMDEKIDIMSKFDEMLHAVTNAPQVIIARVQGAAMGGGFGLVCASDIAVAGERAKFGLPEVRMGLAPALISPYVIDRMGLPNARRLMLTGGRLDAGQAHAQGIVHEVCSDDELDTKIAATVADVLQGSPNALAATKALIAEVTSKPPAETLTYRAQLINQLRESAEGQEGMLAFLQKSKPSWAK